MTPPAPKASGTPWLARLFSLVFLLLACFVLPQQAAAQQMYNVSLSATAPAPASEGETITFTVELDNPVAETFSLGWTASNGTATVADDLDDQSGTVEIPANAQTATFTVPVTRDGAAEGSETFTVALTGPPTGLATIAPSRITVGSSTATGTINASTAPPSTVLSWDLSRTSFVENELSGVIRLIATPPVDTRINFTWSITHVSLDGVVQSVSRRTSPSVIGANQDGTNLVLMLTNDNLVEATEFFHVAVTGATREDGGVVTFDNTAGRNLSVTDDDRSIVSISPTATVAEGGMITFTVNLSHLVTEAFELAWEASNGTGADAATVADDLKTQSGRVMIPANSSTATFQIETSADDGFEADEVFTVTLSGAALGLSNVDPGRISIHADNHTATGTITDTDTANVSLRATAPPPASEGGTMTFTVDLDNPVPETFSLGWTASNGTATVADDLDDQSGTVEIPANSRTATFTIPITNDTDAEDSETFTVALTGPPTGLVNILPSRITVGSSTATGTINASDPPDLTVDTPTRISSTPSLGVPFEADVTVRNQGNNASAATVLRFFISSDATITTADTELTTTPTTLSVGALSANGQQSVSAVFSISTPGTSWVGACVTPVSGETDTGNNCSTGVQIQVPDQPDLTVRNARVSSASVAAGASFTISATVHNSGSAAAAAATLTYYRSTDRFIGGTNDTPIGTDPVSALAAGGSSAENAPVSIDTIGTYWIGACVATLSDEANIENNCSTGVQVTITDPDTATVSLGSTDPPPASEGGTITFTVNIDKPVAETFSLGWAASNGTATVADDLDDQSGTVEIPANSRTATFTVPITNDDDAEGSETFTVALTGPPTGLVNIAPSLITVGGSTATGTINASDDPQNNRVSIGDRTVAENVSGGNIVFTVSLERAVNSDVELEVVYAPGPTNPVTLGDDLPRFLTSAVVIDEGETEATFTVPIFDDDIVEGNETFTVTLYIDSAPTGVTVAGATATGTITDTDTATVSLRSTAPPAPEGGTMTFTVDLDKPVPETFSLGWTASNGTATVSDDLKAQTGRVTIPANSSTATFQIEISADNVVEADEVFTVTLTGAALGLSNVDPDSISIHATNHTATGTITDTDTADVSLRSTAPAATEGGAITFTVDLDNPVAETFSLGWAASDGTATVAIDLDDQTGTVEIPANARTATFTVPVTNDDAAEGSETFTVALTGAPTGLVNILPSWVTVDRTSATGTINASDDPGNNAVSIRNSTVAEDVAGGNMVFTVSLDRAVNSDVELEVTYALGTTNPVTLGDDLPRFLPDTVVIDQGETSATFTVPVTDDAIVEGNETFTVTLYIDSAPTGVTVTGATATGTITDNDTATVSLSSTPPPAASESETITFTVNIDNPVAETFSLGWTATDGTATVAVDLDDQSGTVEIPANARTATFTVPVTRDDAAEGSETFTVALTGAPTGLATIAPNRITVDRTSATGTINASTAPPPVVTATVGIDDESVVENVSGGTVTFTATLSQAVGSPVVLAVEVTAGTATLGVDLGADLPTTVTIDANTTEATFTVPITDDTSVEGNETFTVTLSESATTSLPDGVTIPDGIATGTITDTDTANVSLRATAPPASEGGTITFTVDLDKPVPETFSLGWTATDGTATVENDLDDRSGTVRIPANARTATFTVPVARDDAAEGSETFTVALTGAPTGLATIAPNRITVDRTSATGTINASTAPPPAPSATVSIIAEKTAVENAADGGAATFTVSLSRTAVVDMVLTVAYAGGTNNPATPADDLGSDRPTTVIINRGTAGTTLTVPINNDAIVEGDETFTVTLGEDKDNPLPEGVTIGNGVATGTIEDDDEAEVTLTANTATANENGGTFTYTVKLSAAVDAAVNITWTASAEADDTATVADDLKAPLTGTVTFRANSNADAEQTFTIGPINDNDEEENETFTVTLTPAGTLPTGVSIPTATASSAATIIDDDAPVVNATVSIDDESVVENVSGGTVTFTATLSQAISSPVVLAIAVTAGTATLGVDLGTDLPTTVTIDQGQTEATFTVPIADDTIVEGNETFTVTLSEDKDNNPLPDGVTIRDDKATGTITENDTAEITLTANTATATENGGAFTYTVKLSAAVAEAVNITWTASAGPGDTATVADDLKAPHTGTVTFRANGNADAEQTFNIGPINDNDEEGNETFTVTLTPTGTLPTGVSIPTATASSAATIIDDDGPTVVSTVSIDDASVVENGGNAEFTVSLTAAVESDVTLAVAYTTGTATLATDLGTRPGTVTIEKGQTEATLIVPITDDTIVESNEDFTVTISEGATPLPDGVMIGNGIATGTITENDTAEVTLTANTATANENGGTFSYTVNLSAAADEAVTVRWTAATGPGDTATVANDLQATTNTVTFAANDNTAQTFTIRPINDDEDEDNETFTVTLEVDTQGGNPLPTGVTIGTSNSSTATITDDDEAQDSQNSITTSGSTLTISNANPVNEGGTASFEITIDPPISSSSINPTVSYTAGSADLEDLGSDRPTGTVQISGGISNFTLEVPINDDGIAEGEETFTVRLTFGSAGSIQATGTINASDDGGTSPPSVDISIAPASAEEGDDIRFTVSLSTALLEPRTLNIGYTAGSGNTGAGLDDLGSDRPTTLTLPTGVTSVNLDVPTVEDTDEEEDETFTVTLSLPDPPDDPMNTLAITTATATGTITDDDGTSVVTATVDIDDESVVENVSGGTVTFTATLSQAVNSPVVLAVEVTAGTATLGVDLGTDLPTTVTIDQGQTSATFTVPITDDTIVEGNETFTVTLSESNTTSLPEGVTIPDGIATGTITENDTAEITLTANTATANENGGTFSYTVNLSAAADEAVTVRWTAATGPGDTATVANDLQATTNTVTFAANDNTAQTFTIRPTNDNEDEDNETFTVTLEVDTQGGNPLPTGVTIGTNNTATGTITDDDDDTPVVTATVDIDDESVVENVSGGTVTFTATLSQAINSPVVLAVAVTADTATLGVDLGTDLPTTVTIDANTTEATFTVPITDDTIVEGNETFTVTLSESDTTSLPEGVTIPDGIATGTITENDTAEITLTANTATANENGGTFSYTVNLSAAADEAVTVRWTAATGPGDTATVANDLQATTNTVTFAANDNTAQTFTIRPTNDNEDEDNETFTVTLEMDTQGNNPLPTGVTIGTDNTATGTITDDDDDTPVVTATVDIDDESVAENVSGGTVTFTATLSQAVDSPVVLAVAVTAGTATLGVDLGTDLPTTVTIDANTTEATFTVPITDDTSVEGNETFTVTLSESDTTVLPDGVTIPDGIATGTITENDTAEITLTANTATANENGGTFSYTVNLSAAADEAVTVRWTATDGTAIVANDLQATTNTVTFAANDNTAQTFTISPTNDDEDEDNETFTVTLEVDTEGNNPLPTGVTIGTNNSLMATITDDDDTPVVTATVSIADRTAAEGAGAIGFTVSLSRAVDSDVTLAVAYTAGSAEPETDLGTPLLTTVTISEGETSTTLSVPVIDDDIVEDNETFTVTLSEDPATPLPDDVDIGNGVATGTITDNDEAAPPVTATVNIADADPVTEDAGPARFTVSLSRAVGRDVVLDIAYAAGTASLADLGNPRPATVTIKTGATKAAFDVPIFDDDMVEGTETFTVTLTVNTAPDGVTVADGVATGTIAATAEPSVLIEPRRIGAGTALRRHVSRFDKMTGTVVRGRLRGSGMKALSFAEDMKNGRMAAGGQLGKTRWGSWIDGSYAGFGGKATGRQADVYGGFDFLGGNGKWLIGALAGHEMADLEIGKATYSASYTHLGLYGGVRLSDRLVFDGALTYGMATPEVTLGDVSASYDANRITARIALTGDFGLAYGLGTGSVKVEPQVGLLYSREALGAFTDSAGGVAGGEVLELGRFSFGPRLTWDFDWGQMVGGARVQWDFLQLEDGVDGRLSGAADIGLRFDIAPGVTLDLQGDVDGIGIAEGFRNFGGTIGLQFDLAPDITLGLQGNVDGIGITDDSRSLGSKGVGVGGRVQLGVRF